MSRALRFLSILVAVGCVAFAIYVVMRPGSPRDLSGLERAAAAGEIQHYTDGEVWASDFHRIEPALHAAAGDGEIRLMIGGTCVGVYSRRAGIQTRESP